MGNRAALFTLGLGGAAIAAMSRKAKAMRTADRWVWPVPMFEGYRPVVSDGWGSIRRSPDSTARSHLGADIMFRRRSAADRSVEFPAGTSGGSKAHFMPSGVMALAAADGVVRFAAATRRGSTAVIRHAEGWTTYYTHLESLRVAVGDAVRAGQPIGVVGHDPTDPRGLRHLHFELWRGHKRSGAIDPAPYLAAWERVAVEPTQLVRNGGLTYRPIGRPGEAYPAWLRALKGRSGVYVIKERGEVVYVGESHSGKLYETLTRHFQAWRRWKGFWKGQFAEGHDPGLTYERAAVEVAVRETRPGDAIDEERRLIQRLRPRDNLLGRPAELEAVPF